jgi:hypothetical protein
MLLFMVHEQVNRGEVGFVFRGVPGCAITLKK